MFNVIKKLLKNIKSDKPLKYSLYVNKNGITLIQNKYYSSVSHYELYGTQKHKYNSKQWCDSYDFS